MRSGCMIVPSRTGRLKWAEAKDQGTSTKDWLTIHTFPAQQGTPARKKLAVMFCDISMADAALFHGMRKTTWESMKS